MKKILFPLIFAFIGLTTMPPLVAQTYDPYDVQVINNLIANNGLQATPDAPETWPFFWNNENPKQLIGLGLSDKNLFGNASFAGLTALQELYCYGNNLTKIDLSNCISLRDAQLAQNSLTEINVSNCTNLQVLGCSQNNLTELDVSNCAQLRNLNCGYNYLTELDVSNCAQLRTLHCSNNYLTQLKLPKSTRLALFCENNHLTELNLPNSTPILYIDCEANRLTELDLTGSPNLGSMEFDGRYQNVSLTLSENETGEYTHSILLNNPTFGNSTISYWDGMLKSIDSTVTSSSFTVQTIGNSDCQLKGTMNLSYSILGIEDPENIQLKIYPNPTTGELRIENYELRIENIEIFDISGRNVLSHTSHLTPHTILNISHLPAGIYFIKINTEAGTKTLKVMKH